MNAAVDTTESDALKLFEREAASPREITKEDFADLQSLITAKQAVESDIQVLENMLSKLQARLKTIDEVFIPDFFLQHGMTQIKLVDGSVVTIKKFYSVSIPEENWPRAKQWLIDQGCDEIIKTEIKQNFGKGEREQVAEMEQLLKDNGWEFSTKEGVHSQTLKAFAKDRLESGAEIPQDIFNVYVGNKATIK